MTDDIGRLIRTAAPGDAAGLAGVEDAVWSRVSERVRVRLTESDGRDGVWLVDADPETP